MEMKDLIQRIAEALVATAAGLLTAIPAVVAYNRMTHHGANKGRDNNLPFMNPQCLQTKIECGASVTGCNRVFNPKVFGKISFKLADCILVE